MKTLSLIVLVLCFTFATPATARDKDGNYSAQGPPSCGVWIHDRKEDGWEHVANAAWISGYITAYNIQTPGVYSILGSTDMESVRLWMDKYCQENPLKKLNNGMIVLTHELLPNRKRTKED